MAQDSKKLRVGVFAGGVSSERDVSLKSAAQVIAHLSPEKYDRITPVPLGSTENLDLAFIAMHGAFAEDGRIQSLFEITGLPYTGSGVLASAIGIHKAKTRQVAAHRGIVSPALFELHEMPVDLDEIDARIVSEIGYPCVIKPTTSGSSMGISIVDDRTELASALTAAFAEKGSVLIEQYVRGREFTCGVMGNSHRTELTALPVVEIVTASRFFDYSAKYDSAETQEICPADIAPELAARIQEAAVAAHESLDCDGVTRSDFILGEDGILYFLEINTIPGMTAASICPKEAQAAGMSFPQFLDRIIDLALQRHTRP